MTGIVTNICSQETLTRDDIIYLLKTEGQDKEELFSVAAEVKRAFVGTDVYLRGLIELSNVCMKNCYYCGIRRDNRFLQRYTLSDSQILSASRMVYSNKMGSLVLQSGELTNPSFISRISRLLKDVKELSSGELGITLSLGEQTRETLVNWFESGAHRYLLRIETSNEEFYKRLHPDDGIHRFHERLQCLHVLKEIGYQTGTGVMIGLPDQKIEYLADDLIFMKDFNIDMVGMGPYIEHEDTPLFEKRNKLLPLKDRFSLTLKMIAILRIMMKDINIAATTALQVIDKNGREKAIQAGANVMMPNCTPGHFRDDYALYKNKPSTVNCHEDRLDLLEKKLKSLDHQIAFNQWGDSKHFFKRMETR